MRAKEFSNSKDNFVGMFRKFLPIAIKVIGLKSLPKFIFEKEVNSPDQPTFGQYSNGDHVLQVSLANRHPNDILRTIAHELTHYKQDTDHKLNDMSGNTGSPEENEAHAVAGVVMRHFNKLHPEYLNSKPIVSESWSNKYKKSINCSNPKGFSQRAHCQGRKKNESAGDRGDIPTGPQQQLIPFPKGTTMIDVSDVYDWYKLGMVISDLDDADPKMFGQGAPHTVIAFGSEEEEHKLLPLLKRLGLKLHDIDRPEDVKKAIPAKMFAQDLAETIRKLGSQYRLVSKSGKNLGTYPSKSDAEKRERQVQYFKHIGEEAIAESKSSPLYHFTSFNNLIRILHSNQLISPNNKIYFTRDYSRQFIPSQLFKQSYGLRINQELLARDYGRKLQAGGQLGAWDEKKRQDWLSDPKNAREIEIVKQTGKGSGMIYQGADPKDIVKGTITQKQRWESEEHLNVKTLDNLNKYITGIVISDAPTGNAHFTQELDPDLLTKIADVLISLFSGPKGFDQRNWFLDTAIKLNVPIIYERKEFDPNQVKKRIIQLYSQRKKEREKEKSLPQQHFLIFTSPDGRSSVVSGSDINAVFKNLSRDFVWSDKRIYGYQIGLDTNSEKKMFDEPMTISQLVKNLKMQNVEENFADGRNPQDKGDSARNGIRKGMTIAQLKKVRSSDNASPRKKQLAHWQINMRQGRNK